MRFPILVAAAAISGGIAVFSFKTLFPQQNAYLAATARKAMTDVAQFNFSKLNPVRAAYDDVTRDIASPKPIEGLNFKPTSLGEIKMVPLPSVAPLNLGGGLASHTNVQPRWHGAR
jgi:hypothetical protein